MDDTRKGIEGNRARNAYEQVENVVKNNPKIKKEYRSYVKKIPMLIKTNGLGATFAFIKSKHNDAYTEIYNQVQQWIKNDEGKVIELDDGEDLMKKIVELPSSLYRALTNEILSYFNWLRRFAEGLIEGED